MASRFAGEIRAAGENQVQAALRRQGVTPTKIKKRRMRSGQAIKPKDLAIFTRQLATMMKAGVPCCRRLILSGAATQSQRHQAAQRHPHRCRNRNLTERRVSKISALFRQPVLQPGRSR
jgi:type II secretory pathway component PulF